jgi:sugar lactone lactonase YvrE
MRPSTLPIATAAVIAAIAACALVQPAGASVLQTIGNVPPQKLRYAQNIALGPSGTIFVLDTSGTFPDPNVFVKVYSAAGDGLRRWRIASRNDDLFDIAVDAAENVYVAERSERKVLKYSPAGVLLAEVRLPGTAEHLMDMHVAIDPAGNLVVAEGDGRLWTFDLAGRLIASRELLAPDDRVRNGVYGVAVTASGAIWVTDTRGIALVDPAGGPLRYIARRGPRPQDVADTRAIAAGPANTLYVVGAQRVARIQRFGGDGTYLGSTANGSGWTDAAVAGDGSILAVAFAGPNSSVQRLSPIATVDVTPPVVDIRDVATRPRGGSSRSTLRLRYTLSERSAVRVTFARRAERGRYAGRYRQTETIRVPAAAAGRHTFEWLARSVRQALLRRGDYKVFVVAWDDAGLESAGARASFKLRRL